MDQHPIPQDVTGFQFKLIGSMTVKQFGYVAVGVIAAVILYYLPLNSAFGVLIKVLFIPLFGASGVIIAFVPIEGRPIDVMAANFSKAILSPNQYVYHKVGRKFSFSTVSVIKAEPSTTTAQKVIPQKQKLADQREQKLQAYLLNSQGKVKNDLDKKEIAFLKNFAPATTTIATGAASTHPEAATLQPAVALAKPLNTASPIAKPAIPPLMQQPVPSIKNTSEKETPDSLAKQEAVIEQQLQSAKQDEAKQSPDAASAAHQKVLLLEKQMEEIHQQKQHLEQELAKLKSQLSTPSPQPVAAPSVQVQAAAVTPPPAAQPPATVQPMQAPAASYVRNVPQAMTKTAGLPHVSDTPNVVVGLVKDARGNVLPNMLVEVKDKEGNPVRAFKTNPLGQFASATPLASGTYTIELEDPKKQHSFDVIQISANNQILLPIEIISHDAREALRQQLFN